jgi:hypothetical protein
LNYTFDICVSDLFFSLVTFFSVIAFEYFNKWFLRILIIILLLVSILIHICLCCLFAHVFHNLDFVIIQCFAIVYCQAVNKRFCTNYLLFISSRSLRIHNWRLRNILGDLFLRLNIFQWYWLNFLLLFNKYLLRLTIKLC